MNVLDFQNLELYGIHWELWLVVTIIKDCISFELEMRRQHTKQTAWLHPVAQEPFI